MFRQINPGNRHVNTCGNQHVNDSDAQRVAAPFFKHLMDERIIRIVVVFDVSGKPVQVIKNMVKYLDLFQRCEVFVEFKPDILSDCLDGLLNFLFVQTGIKISCYVEPGFQKIYLSLFGPTSEIRCQPVK